MCASASNQRRTLRARQQCPLAPASRVSASHEAPLKAVAADTSAQMSSVSTSAVDASHDGSHFGPGGGIYTRVDDSEIHRSDGANSEQAGHREPSRPTETNELLHLSIRCSDKLSRILLRISRERQDQHRARDHLSQLKLKMTHQQCMLEQKLASCNATAVSNSSVKVNRDGGAAPSKHTAVVSGGAPAEREAAGSAVSDQNRFAIDSPKGSSTDGTRARSPSFCSALAIMAPDGQRARNNSTHVAVASFIFRQQRRARELSHEALASSTAGEDDSDVLAPAADASPSPKRQRAA